MLTAIRFRFTAALCERLSFDQQIVGVDDNGKPVTAPTAPEAKEWWCADELVRGLWIRVTPGAATWTIRRKLMGRTTSRAMAQVKRPGVRGDAIGLDVARERARTYLAEMAQGRDPILVKADQVAKTKKARAERALTMGKVYEDFCSKDSVKASTQIDRKKVIKWMSPSPLWRTPWAQVTPEVVEESMGPLRSWVQSGQRPTGLRWGPDSISPGTLHKIQAYLKSAWSRQARHARSAATGRGEGPFALWQADGKWPEQRHRSGMLDTATNAGKAWIAALVDLRQQAHAATGQRISVRSTAVKPSLGVLCDYYLLVLIWGTRLSETAQLTWEAVNWDDGLVQLAPETTKTGKEGIVPLTHWAREILMERKRLNTIWRPEESAFCFPSRRHGKPISNPRGILTTLNEASGLAISTHDLRARWRPTWVARLTRIKRPGC